MDHLTCLLAGLRARRSTASPKKRGFCESISPWIPASFCLYGLALAVAAGCSDRPSADARVSASRPESAAASGSSPSPVGNPESVDVKPSAAESGTAGTTTSAGGQAKTGPASDVPPPAPAEQAKKIRREPLFLGWPKPALALYITGRQYGYIEPCGCSGLTNQKGGLVRRYGCKRQLEQQGWQVVALDVGNQVRRFGRQAEIKFQMTAEGLKRMNYQAIGFGPDDLRLSAGELIAITADEGDSSSAFLCVNAAIIDRALMPRYRIIEAGGKKIGVTAVLGTEELAQITSDEIIKQPPEEALREVWPELEQKACDLYVLLAHASIEASTALVQKFSQFDIVVTAGGAGEPTFEAERIAGTGAVMVQVGTKGMYTGVIGLFDDPAQPLRYQRVPLDDRFPDSPEMLQLLASYQDQLKAAGLEGLGIKPIPYPTDRKFVGSEACLDCHEPEYKTWEKTTHARALETLIHPGERSEVPRHFDPECLSCHVIGWNPQKYFPYVSGYLGVDETPLMHHVGCENCHGPGSAHVKVEEDGGPTEMLNKLREEVTLPLPEAEKKCMECHDLDNSPDFHEPGAFDRYWKKIEH